jgi:hypothetical protein
MVFIYLWTANQTRARYVHWTFFNGSFFVTGTLWHKWLTDPQRLMLSFHREKQLMDHDCQAGMTFPISPGVFMDLISSPHQWNVMEVTQHSWVKVFKNWIHNILLFFLSGYWQNDDRIKKSQDGKARRWKLAGSLSYCLSESHLTCIKLEVKHEISFVGLSCWVLEILSTASIPWWDWAYSPDIPH